MQPTVAVSELYRAKHSFHYKVYAIIVSMLLLVLTACSSSSSSGLVEFQTNTIAGDKIDDSVFSEYKLTMINVWTTWCGFCIEEMPELQEIYEELAENGVGVIGIAADANNEEALQLTRKILEDNGVTYPNLVPDKSLEKGLLSDLSAYPTSFFVDSEGKLCGATLVGGTKETYVEEINRILENMENE